MAYPDIKISIPGMGGVTQQIFIREDSAPSSNLLHIPSLRSKRFCAV